MLCWLITICTIARLWIVISFEKWEWGSLTETDSAVRTALCIRDSFECCERGRSRVWPTRLAFAIRKWERGTEGGAESERLSERFTATGNTTERTNERTNERLFLANWTTRTDSRKQIMKSITSWDWRVAPHCVTLEPASKPTPIGRSAPNYLRCVMPVWTVSGISWSSRDQAGLTRLEKWTTNSFFMLWLLILKQEWDACLVNIEAKKSTRAFLTMSKYCSHVKVLQLARCVWCSLCRKGTLLLFQTW